MTQIKINLLTNMNDIAHKKRIYLKYRGGGRNYGNEGEKDDIEIYGCSTYGKKDTLIWGFFTKQTSIYNRSKQNRCS